MNPAPGNGDGGRSGAAAEGVRDAGAAFTRPSPAPWSLCGMDVARTGPVALAEQRLHWLDARQRVLARNIAHADTPGFVPSDLAPFGAAVARAVAPVRTDPRHIAPPGGPERARRDPQLAERSPNGNAVSLDREALRVAETDQAHALAMGLHRKYLGLFRAALGRN